MAFNPLAVFTGDPLKEGAAAQEAAAQKGYAQYADLAGQGRGALERNYMTAINRVDPIAANYNRGQQSYLDALGINGPEASAAARNRFQTSPGFDFQLQTGLDALTRAGVAQGRASGNVGVDAMKMGTGLANQDWWNWVNAQKDFGGQALQAAGMQGGWNTGLGQGLLGSYTGQGGQAVDMWNRVGEAQKDQAMSEYIGSQNLWNFGLEAAKTAASFIPGAGGMGGGGGGSPFKPPQKSASSGFQMPGSGPFPKLF